MESKEDREVSKRPVNLKEGKTVSMAIRPAMMISGINRTSFLNVQLLCKTAGHITPTRLASLFSQHLGLPCRDISPDIIMVQGRPSLTETVAAWDSILAVDSGVACDRVPMRIQKREPHTLSDFGRRDDPAPLSGSGDGGH